MQFSSVIDFIIAPLVYSVIVSNDLLVMEYCNILYSFSHFTIPNILIALYKYWL